LPNNQSILVDLGFSRDAWLPAVPLTIAAPIGRLRPFEKAGMVTPVNRPASRDWYWRSPVEMGHALGRNVRNDYFVVLDLKASQFLPAPPLEQGPVTATLPNNHLEYALTWFSLAWIMLGIFIAFVRQKQVIHD